MVGTAAKRHAGTARGRLPIAARAMCDTLLQSRRHTAEGEEGAVALRARASCSLYLRHEMRLSFRTPLSEKLLEPSDYIFVARTLSGKNEELYDETRRLCDLHLFLPVLKLIEPVGNREEKVFSPLLSCLNASSPLQRLNADIFTAIARPLAELDDIKDMDNEVLEARCSFYRTVEQVMVFNVCSPHVFPQIVQERHIDAIDQYALPRDSVLNVSNMPEAQGALSNN